MEGLLKTNDLCLCWAAAMLPNLACYFQSPFVRFCTRVTEKDFGSRDACRVVSSSWIAQTAFTLRERDNLGCERGSRFIIVQVRGMHELVRLRPHYLYQSVRNKLCRAQMGDVFWK